MQKHKTPRDLAHIVTDKVSGDTALELTAEVLAEFFEVLYFASLRTEEAESIVCNLAFLDPNQPEDPLRIELDRWTATRFEKPLSFAIDTLVKLAHATDPRTSSIAVYVRGGKLEIWGLIDQESAYHEFVNFEADVEPDRPGAFTASIAGIGHLVVYREAKRIAELRIDELITDSHDVIRRGPVSEKLRVGRGRFISALPSEVTDSPLFDFWQPELEKAWDAVLARLLLRIRSLKHGGALLITDVPPSATVLKPKYVLEYRRLHEALSHQAKHLLASAELVMDLDGWTDPFTGTLSHGEVARFRETVVAESHQQRYLEGSARELQGALWFVALLSRVDGLVQMTPDLHVKAFGVEIREAQESVTVVRSSTASASTVSLKPADFEHFGTRHRSMMRYCSQDPNSVGFVVSQDGDVRAITRVGENVVLWDRVRLQIDQFPRERRSRSARRQGSI